MRLNQIGMSDDVIEASESHFCQIFPDFLRQESEEIDEILISSDEVLSQQWVLRGHSHRASIEITFPHHHTSKNDESRSSERKFLCSKESHDDDVAPSLDLSIDLQSDPISQSVAHQRLLSLAESDFGRYTRKPHGAGWRSTCSSLSTADDDDVRLRLCHTSGNGTHSTFRHELDRHGGFRVDIFQVEDKLSQVLNAIDVVMRGR